MRGGWRLEPSASGCQVQVWWRVVPRYPWAAAVLLPVMAAGAQRGFADVIARMTLAAKGLPLPPLSEGVSSPPRLRAAAC